MTVVWLLLNFCCCCSSYSQFYGLNNMPAHKSEYSHDKFGRTFYPGALCAVIYCMLSYTKCNETTDIGIDFACNAESLTREKESKNENERKDCAKS